MMHLKTTRTEIKELFETMSLDEIVSYLETRGLTLEAELSPILSGVYRREGGSDLIYTAGHGEWNRVDVYGTYCGDWEIVWARSGGNQDWWVRILDGQMRIVTDGLRVLMARNGNRVG